MSETITIKQGLDIKLLGGAHQEISHVDSGFYAIKPGDFIGVFPKLLVQEGDKVKAGTQLFYDKTWDFLRLTSPVSGIVKEIRRGAKRVLFEIIIEPGTVQEYEDFGKSDPNTLTKEQIIEKLVQSGVWPMLRQRPYNVVANPNDQPKAIFISAFDTSPLAPDYNFIVNGEVEAFQTGIDALAKLTSGKIHLNLKRSESISEFFTKTSKVQFNYFEGPHPAGNVGVQINKIDPINKGEVVWHLRPQEVLTIGRLFLKGYFDAEKIIAVTGSEVIKPAYVKTKIGACIQDILKNNLKEGNLRFISGNPLTGTKIDQQGFISFYDSQITVLPEGDYYEFIGWALPGFSKFSHSRTFFSWLHPKNKKYRLDTNLHGGHRALVMTGEMEKVFPFDIYPLQLLKAIIVEDVEAMENLGIYEVVEEDFALAEYLDTSKTEIQALVRKGLDLMRKEMS